MKDELLILQNTDNNGFNHLHLVDKAGNKIIKLDTFDLLNNIDWQIALKQLHNDMIIKRFYSYRNILEQGKYKEFVALINQHFTKIIIEELKKHS